MKILILFLIFILPTNIFAKTDINSNNILKIGGIRLFDNLYDYLTPKMVREKGKNFKNYYKHLKKPFEYPTIAIENHPIINKKYKRVELNYKNVGGQLIVHMLKGGEFYKNINYCHKDINNLAQYFSKKISNLKKVGPYDENHPADLKGESKIYGYSFLSDNYIIQIACTDWSNKITKMKNWKDNLSITITSNEFHLWTTQLK